MKILHIVRQYNPSIGGLEKYVSSLVKEQDKFNYDITILTLNKVFNFYKNSLSNKVVDGIEVIRIPFIGRSKFFIPLLRPSHLKGYDVIHIHGLDQFADIMAFYSLFGKNLKNKLILTSHGLFFHTEDFKYIKYLYFRIISRFSLSRMKYIFSVSKNDSDILGKINRKSRLIYNPIIPFNDTKAEGEDFVYIGRLCENKRITLLLDVFKEIKKRNNNPINLHIIGSGSDKFLNDIKRYSKQINIDNSTIFHGFKSSNDMKEIIKKCRYNISASRYEGFGMAMVEGMSAGLIPVMHNNKAFEEIYLRSKIGFIGDFTDVDKFVDNFNKWKHNFSDELREKAISFASIHTYRDICYEIDSYYQKISNDENIPYKLCGIPINTHTNKSAISLINKKLQLKHNLNVSFVNTNLCVKLHNHSNRENILNILNLNLNDGIGCDFGYFISNNKRFPCNLNGTDFIPLLLKNIPDKTKIALYGSEDEIISKSASILKHDYNLDIVFKNNGYDPIENIVDKLRKSNAEIILIAQGNPIQEETILKLRQKKINIPIMIGVGGFFDFMSGKNKRAPKLMRKYRLEWLYRLWLEPKRLSRRYTIDILFYIYLIFRYKIVK